MMNAFDRSHISENKNCLDRTIMIPVTINDDNRMKRISATDFDITPKQVQALYENGVNGAKRFLSK